MYRIVTIHSYAITGSFIKHNFYTQCVNKLAYIMDVNQVLEHAECYVHQLSQHSKLPDEIRTIINDLLPARLETPMCYEFQIFTVKTFIYCEPHLPCFSADNHYKDNDKAVRNLYCLIIVH